MSPEVVVHVFTAPALETIFSFLVRLSAGFWEACFNFWSECAHVMATVHRLLVFSAVNTGLWQLMILFYVLGVPCLFFMSS